MSWMCKGCWEETNPVFNYPLENTTHEMSSRVDFLSKRLNCLGEFLWHLCNFGIWEPRHHIRFVPTFHQSSLESSASKIRSPALKRPGKQNTLLCLSLSFFCCFFFFLRPYRNIVCNPKCRLWWFFMIQEMHESFYPVATCAVITSTCFEPKAALDKQFSDFFNAALQWWKHIAAADRFAKWGQFN